MPSTPTIGAILRAMWDQSADPMYVKDLQGRFILINEAGARIIGRNASEIIGKDDSELFPPETALEFMEKDRAVVASGRT